MPVFINSCSAITPQKTFEENFFKQAVVVHNGNRLSCIEPSYEKFVDAKQMRRMSKVIKMGVACSIKSLNDASLKIPDAIIVGTAFGCLTDTGAFISKMVEHNEEMLNPTAFIHSTHNTIAGQIALLLQCRNYNSTYVHKNISFESALIDAMMLLNEKTISNALVGGIDELTDVSFTIMNRMLWWKENMNSNLELYKQNSTGTIAGEGASFFVLANSQTEKTFCEIKFVQTLFNPSTEKIQATIDSLLKAHSLELNQIDAFITSHNGDKNQDETCDEISSALNLKHCEVRFKHLVGESMTSSAFATFLGANMLKQNSFPACLEDFDKSKTSLKNILIHNHFRNQQHAFILLSAC